MALIEYKQCSKHGKTSHVDGKCPGCQEDESVIKQQVKDALRNEFFKLPADQQIAYLYSKLEDT